MAFTYTGGDLAGGTRDATSLKRYIGTYSNAGGSTGGAITVPLSVIHAAILQPIKATVTSQHVVNETVANVPLNQVTVTIVTGANEAGFYEIIGY